MERRYGQARRGRRVQGYALAGHWTITTLLAGLTLDGLMAPLVIDQPMNREIFTRYIRQFLAPERSLGDLVILDNLSSQKGAQAAALIHVCGAKLLFLPPYSPDLNPIEMAFWKF